MGAEWRETFAVWERYQERQHQRMALATFWHEVLEMLVRSEDSVPGLVLVAECQHLAGSSEILTKWVGVDPGVPSSRPRPR